MGECEIAWLDVAYRALTNPSTRPGAAARSDLLLWVNDLLQADYTKIEEFGKGWVYCQVGGPFCF